MWLDMTSGVLLKYKERRDAALRHWDAPLVFIHSCDDIRVIT